MKTYFRSTPVYDQSPSSIDKELGIIKGVKICQLGEAKGHGVNINSAFLDKVVEFGNQSKAGLKARFGHPNICSTALGTYLGRYKNFRSNGAEAYADLHLDKSAKKSPKGNLFEYVLDLAETNPDMFGASIAFKAGEPIIEFETIDGKKTEVRYATIKSLHACDMVDDPAATDGLFETFHEEDFAFQASVFLDEHPEIYKLLDNKPEILNEFLLNYKHHKNDKTMNILDEIKSLKSWVTDNFSKKNESGHPELVEGLQADFNSKIEALESSLPSQEKFDELQAVHNGLNTNILEFATAHKFDKEKDVLAQATSHIKLQAEKIEQLESDLNRSKANATLPPDTTDPLLNLKNGEVDKSGKALFKQLPRKVQKQLQTSK